MDIRAILKTVLFTPGIKGRWGLPVLFEGAPGTGKTAILEEVAQASGLHCEVVIASIREPADFLGLPVPDGERTRYLAPSWAVRAVAKKRAVVLFDEMNTAPPATQAGQLRTINERVAGDLDLGDGVRFLGAQNKTEDATGGWDLSAPMANRFLHLPWSSPDVQTWSTWLLGGADGGEAAGASAAEDEERRVLASWDKPFAVARGLVTGFLRSRPELLHKQPASGDAAASKAWPSPRTWEMATRALAGAKVHGLSPVDEDELAAAAVGAPAAGELMTWRQNADLPDPEALLDEHVEFDHDPRRLDRTCAILASCAALLGSPTLKKREARNKVMWGMMGKVVKSNADLVVPAGLALVAAKLTGAAEARPVLATLAPVLRAAGVDARRA